MESPLSRSPQIQDLSSIHGMTTEEKKYKMYLAGKTVVVTGMGACKECKKEYSWVSLSPTTKAPCNGTSQKVKKQPLLKHHKVDS